MAAKRSLHFDKFGRAYQLRIRTAEQLAGVTSLDDSFWVATSAPVSVLDSDPEFLDGVDLDDNGRIRVDEVRAAIEWLFERLADGSHLADGTDEVELAWIDEAQPAGRRLTDAARYILATLAEDGSETINVAQVRAFERGLDERPVNGDGVITPDAAPDECTTRFIADAAECTGGKEDLTGRRGITEEQLNAFLAEARAYLEWAGEGDLPPGVSSTAVMPLGERTPAAYEAFHAIEAKMEGFFARCRVVRFNPSAAERIGIGANEVQPADLADPAAIDASLARAPLAEPNPEGLLALDESVNPAYGDAVAQFAHKTVAPLLGEDVREFTEGLWQQVKDALAPYAAWRAAKKGAQVEPLGRERLAECSEGPYADEVRAMLRADREVADRLDEARELKKLLLCHKHLMRLANNFVSFPDLYDPARRAVFEMGSLVMDGRWFNFAVKVEDLQEHARIAKTSGMYVLYAEIARIDPATDKLLVAVPATSGTVGNLCAGKRGIFYDTHGRHYDARIVHIIENPISFREALVSPFVRLGRFVGGKIEAISGTTEKTLQTRLGKATRQVQAGVQKAVQQAPTPTGRPPTATPEQQAARTAAGRRDLLLGASVSIAALSSAFAYVTSKLTILVQHPFSALLAGLAVVLIVFIPTAIVAAFKLRRRDLSALLEGCGWAINARMRLDRRQRNQFTRRLPFPKDATGGPRSRWLAWTLLALLALLSAFAALRACQAPHGRRGADAPASAQETAGGPDGPTAPAVRVEP